MDEEKKLLEIIKDLKQTDSVRESESLLISGFLDSFDLINLITEVESAFSLQIPGKEIKEENFDKIEKIANLIRNLKNG